MTSHSANSVVFNNIQILLGPITRAASERYDPDHISAVSRVELTLRFHNVISIIGVTVDGVRRLNIVNMRQIK